MISFLIPLKYNGKNFIYERAIEYILFFENIEFDVELIISDSSKKKLLSSKSKNVKIINTEYSSNIYSPAKSRNEGIVFCSKKYIFFLDVDLSFSETFIKSLLNEVQLKLVKNNAKFLMLPCLYMSELGTKKFDTSQNKKEILELFKKSYLFGENKYVERLAVNTSAIVLEKDYLLTIGMFSEDFQGHGGEDFELLHRLAAHYPHSIKNNDYYYDKVEQFPIKYKGFRQYLALYSFEYFFSDLLLVHRWHKRELFNMFYMNRIKNESLLIEKMKLHDENKYTWKITKPFPDYKDYLESLIVREGYDLNTAIGFHKMKDNIIINRPFSAKMRKLITRPKLFFTDMFKKYKIH